MNELIFIDACLAGTASVDEVDDWIDVWHNGSSDIGLDDFLGLTREEGAAFAKTPEVLPAIVERYREKKQHHG